jgi:hypothetical protein
MRPASCQIRAVQSGLGLFDFPSQAQRLGCAGDEQEMILWSNYLLPVAAYLVMVAIGWGMPNTRME